MSDVDGGHDVVALGNQPRKLLNTLPTTDSPGLVSGQDFGRFHLYLASAFEPPQLEDSGSPNPGSASKASATSSADTWYRPDSISFCISSKADCRVAGSAHGRMR